MRKIVLWVVVSAALSGVADPENPIHRKQHISSLIMRISSYFDSSPDPKYWAELDSFGAEAIPVGAELMHSSRGMSSIVNVFAQLKGNDQLVRDELRRFVVAEMCNVSEGTGACGTSPLYWLARKGNEEDVLLLRGLETHTDPIVKATAKSARIKLEQRLKDENSPSHKRIKWLVSEIIGCFDSIPPRELYNELQNYGSDSRPIIEKMFYTTKGGNQQRLVYLFAANEKYSDYALSFLRNYAKQNCLITANNKSAIFGILDTLADKGVSSDMDMIKSFETNANPFVAAHAVAQREVLELRLKESQKFVPSPVTNKAVQAPPFIYMQRDPSSFSSYSADVLQAMSTEAVITKLTRYSDPDPVELELRRRFESYPPRVTIPILIKVFNESSNMFHKAKAFAFLQYAEEKGGNVSHSLKIARNLLPGLSDSNNDMTLKLNFITCVSTYGEVHDIQLIQSCTNSTQLVVRTIASRELKKFEARLAAAKTNADLSSNVVPRTSMDIGESKELQSSGPTADVSEEYIFKRLNDVAGYIDMDPSRDECYDKLFAISGDKVVPVIVRMLEQENKSAFYKSNLFRVLWQYDRRENTERGLSIARRILLDTGRKERGVSLHYAAIEYLGEKGKDDDARIIRNYVTNSNGSISRIAVYALKGLEDRLAAAKTNTISVPVPVQSVTNATANSSNPANPEAAKQ